MKPTYDPDHAAEYVDALIGDPENPEWTADDFARALGPECLPPEVLAALPRTAAAVARKRAAPAQVPQKESVSLELDGDVVEHFRAAGSDWPSRINAVLRDSIKRAG